MKAKQMIMMLMLAVLPMGLSAQTAGTMIHGTVQDDIEPLFGCNVIEIDKNNRIVAHATTDFNGNFSFRLEEFHPARSHRCEGKESGADQWSCHS